MNDNFIPNGQQGQVVPVQNIPQITELPLEVKVQMKVGEAASDVRVMDIIKDSAKLKQLKNFTKIETTEQYDQAIDCFNLAKERLTEAERLRHEYVDLPTMVSRSINAFFKTIRDGLESSKGHIGVLIDKKKQKDEEEQRKIREEAEKERVKKEAELLKAQELKAKMQEEDGVDGEEEVIVPDFQEESLPKVPPEPSNVVSSEKGAKVHTRTTEVYEVEDLLAFLKGVVSNAKRMEWFTKYRDEVVTVNLAVVKKIDQENKGRKAIPGIKKRVERKTV